MINAQIIDIRDPFESPVFPLTVREAEAIVQAIRYQYINREDDTLYNIITSLERFVEKNK